MTENPCIAPAIWFDLDDTLAFELDFCKSGFRAVAKDISPHLAKYCSESEIELVMGGAAECKMNHYDALRGFLECVMPDGNDAEIERLIQRSVQTCRNHTPDTGYKLKDGVADALSELKEDGALIGIITDGRSSTQRAKFISLNLDKFIDPEFLLISEEFGSGKESQEIYKKASSLSGDHREMYYVGDNPVKDFIHPNAMGWHTIMIAPDRRNIHFPYPSVDKEHAATHIAPSVAEAVRLIMNNNTNKA